MCPKVSVIILNWNNPQDTLQCLESAHKIDYPTFEILIVDNGSSDNSCELITANFPNDLLIKNKKNLGFAEGNNIAIKVALKNNADYIFFLNNDAVVSPDILSVLVSHAQKIPKAGALGPKIFNFDFTRTLQNVGFFWLSHLANFAALKDHVIKKSIEEKNCIPVDFVTGCAFLVSRKVIEKVGFMDGRFFLIWEEIDWQMRMKKAGYCNIVIPFTHVWHKNSASFVGGNEGIIKRYFFFRNRLLFIEKNLSFKEKTQIYLKVFPKEILAYFKHTYLSKNTSNFLKKRYKGYFLGMRDYFFRRFGNCPAHFYDKYK